MSVIDEAITAKRAGELRENLLEYLPGDFSIIATNVIDSVVQIAAVSEEIMAAPVQWDCRATRDFLSLTNRLARGLVLLDTQRIAGCAAEQIAARAFVLAEELLTHLLEEGRA